MLHARLLSADIDEYPARRRGGGGTIRSLPVLPVRAYPPMPCSLRGRCRGSRVGSPWSACPRISPSRPTAGRSGSCDRRSPRRARAGTPQARRWPGSPPTASVSWTSLSRSTRRRTSPSIASIPSPCSSPRMPRTSSMGSSRLRRDSSRHFWKGTAVSLPGQLLVERSAGAGRSRPRASLFTRCWIFMLRVLQPAAQLVDDRQTRSSRCGRSGSAGLPGRRRGAPPSSMAVTVAVRWMRLTIAISPKKSPFSSTETTCVLPAKLLLTRTFPSG